VYFVFGTAPRLRRVYDRSLAWGLLVLPVLFFAESLPPLIRWYHGVFRLHNFSAGHGWSATLALLLPFLLSGRAASALKNLGGRAGLYGLGILGPLVLLSIYLNLGIWAVYGEAPWIGTGLEFGRVIYPIAWFIWLYAYLFVDVNVTSMHDFYRSKLSNAYLIRRRPDGTIFNDDAQALSAMGAAGKTGPYHLINAALNLQGSKDPSYRGRKADFFLFSKRFVGSRCTGYAATADVEQADPHIDLGTAMAISGAAASPNMGATTIRPLVFVMALLNIRLDYWMLHPGYLGGAGRNRAARAQGGPDLFPSGAARPARRERAEDQCVRRLPHREPGDLRAPAAEVPAHHRQRRRGGPGSLLRRTGEPDPSRQNRSRHRHRDRSRSDQAQRLHRWGAYHPRVGLAHGQSLAFGHVWYSVSRLLGRARGHRFHRR